MPIVTINVSQENLDLLLEVTQALGLENSDVAIDGSIPEWHKQVLQERMEDYKNGKAACIDWNDVEKEMDKEDETI